MPCGKLAYQQKGCETQDMRNKKLFPIIQALETDRRMKLRVKMENRGEIKKTQHIAKFRTATQMEERNMDLERRSER